MDAAALQYADHTLRQRELLGDETDEDSEISRQIRYWKDQLAGLPPELPLPLDRPRRPDTGHEGGIVEFGLSPETTAGLRRLASRTGATPFMVAHAALAVLLHRIGGTDDVPVGTLVAGRDDAAVHDLVGFFVNTLVLRTDVGGDPTPAQLVARARAATLDALDHADVPFERLVDLLDVERSLERHPLFQVMLNYQTRTAEGPDLGGLSSEPVAVHTRTAKFDLTFTLVREPGADGPLNGGITYRAGLFDAATVLRRIADWYERVLATFADHPDRPVGDCRLLTDTERPPGPHHLEQRRGTVPPLRSPGSSPRGPPSAPDAPAVIDGERTIPYGELSSRTPSRSPPSSVSAGWGTGAPSRSFFLPRSAELVTAAHAVFQAGGAYPPLDPTTRPPRLSAMLDENPPAVLLTDRAAGAAADGFDRLVVLLDDPRPAAPAGFAPAEPHPAQPAYILHTSGSTAAPRPSPSRTGPSATGSRGRGGASRSGRGPHAGQGRPRIRCVGLGTDRPPARRSHRRPRRTGRAPRPRRNRPADPPTRRPGGPLRAFDAGPVRRRAGSGALHLAAVDLQRRRSPHRHARTALRRGVRSPVVNQYGPPRRPSTSPPAPPYPANSPGPARGPGAGSRAHVLDAALRPVPPG